MTLSLSAAEKVLPPDLRSTAVIRLLQLSLEEDLSPEGFPAGGLLSQYDVTGQATLQPGRRVKARIFSKAEGVAAGLPVAEAVFRMVDQEIEFRAAAADGDSVTSGQNLAVLQGSVGSLLAAERIALNFLGRLSGVATLTRDFVNAIRGTGAVILDTRKTLPGFRIMDKYAVRMGGGQNHRMGLYDMIIIKNNHIDSAGGVAAALDRVRQQFGTRYPVEVEVRTLKELKTALGYAPDRIMLDNMDLDTTRQAVNTTGGRVPLEASGNISLANVRAVAETGVEFISVGALTHSARALDISMHIEKMEPGEFPS